MAWQWLLQAISMQKGLKRDLPKEGKTFYEGKLHVFRQFFSYELPKIGRLVMRLINNDGLTLEMTEDIFN
jgi:hypothetical protein